MKTCVFKCNNEKCKTNEFEMFRFGNNRLDDWKQGKETDPEVKCPDCGTKENIELVEIPKGSGQFKKFPVYQNYIK